jgi:hypothetical protein
MAGDDTLQVPVSYSASESELWTLSLTRSELREITLVLDDGRGRRFEATGGDAFDALMKLRLDLEGYGVQICCNGARRNAWSSGMQRDMGEGLAVYLLQADRSVRPPQVRTLDSAPVGDVVSVAEQREFYETWLPADARRPPE